MNAAFATTLISHEDFVAGLVLLRALTLENMINAIDTEHGEVCREWRVTRCRRFAEFCEGSMLRAVLEDLLVNKTFTEQNYISSLDMAERVLRLAAAGEREADIIKKQLLQELHATRDAA